MAESSANTAGMFTNRLTAIVTICHGITAFTYEQWSHLIMHRTIGLTD